jgi:hypothetical protein
MNGSNTCSLHISHSFKKLGLACFHLETHPLERVVVVGIVAGATSRQRALTLLLAIFLASTICLILLGQLLLLFLGQVLEFIELVVTEGDSSWTFPRLLAISTQTSLMRFTPSTRDIGFKKNLPFFAAFARTGQESAKKVNAFLKLICLSASS